MPVTIEEINNSATQPFGPILDKHGITADALAKELKKELSAKETKFIKIRRNAQADEIVRQITDSVGAKKRVSKVKVVHETTEEQIIAVDVVNWTTRQNARIDAHKLRGDYPSAINKHTFPDKDGNPQSISGSELTDTEKAVRIAYILRKAMENKEHQK
jgi:hypothetical protein